MGKKADCSEKKGFPQWLWPIQADASQDQGLSVTQHAFYIYFTYVTMNLYE